MIPSKLCFLGIILILYGTNYVATSEQGEVIMRWAERFGKELYDLGLVITKSMEIKSRYPLHNARVERKDPKILLAEIVENIERMMDRKMDAIRCILEVAENAAENFESDIGNRTLKYYSSTYSPVDNETVEVPDSLQGNVTYLPMSLNNDTHFYNVPVNTTHSSVHVPVNVYDRHKDARSAIEWSEALDEVFKQNYNSDPALSWQYFGSTSGIMRHYPAMRWKYSDIDLFDCRIRTWFIEAATCTKDVIILVDSSGSMQGMRKHIASLTIYSILDTFSNNDYINVMNYSTSISYTVPCFENILVQATKENIKTFKKAVEAIEPDNKSNASLALGEAFKLLKQYREKRGCDENSSDCNQAIMLVTDGISGNLSSVFEKYNWYNNGTSIPVRIFTYLIGPEVTKVNEIMWAACTNRGYYSHVQSLEEVTGSVFKYIPVIARPLVLHGVEHPISWTHAYVDITYDDENDNIFNEPYRLLTSVAVPAFDRKVNRNNESRTADLLGVAATDVPIDDIAKLTMPYKIGVMAFSFIVSNNGYVLMHPSLRPVFNKTILKENYNSVDFAEIEQHDDDYEAREINPMVLELREALVNGSEGGLFGAKLKYHYDDMRRITRQKYNYYFAPLSDTPFSIGLAIPDSYGNFSIEVGDEIQKNRHTGSNITSFFKGSNWKIHPKWVYCKYHYLEGHEFETPEAELLHFLKRMYDKDFVWARQYEANSKHIHELYEIEVEDNDDIECGRKTLKDDDYYCDRDLIQRLIFDAKNTLEVFKDPWKFNNDREKSLFERYNATLRFVATMSGLTRWEYIFGEEDDVQKEEFGDKHARATDETWYKSAVLQHQYDTESFVYSVPFESGGSDDILVTGSYSIFPKDAGMEAPGSVVGFQFSHDHMQKRFLEIVSKAEANTVACSEMLDCYVVDSSGYIVISHDQNNTGHFFGEIEGAVMDSMLENGIFEKVVIYDFQGYCLNETEKNTSDGGQLLTPYDIIRGTINYLFGNIVWLFVKSNLYQLWDPNWVTAEELLTTVSPRFAQAEKESEEVFEAEEEEDEENDYYPCDLQRDLYLLQQNKFIRDNGWRGDSLNAFFVKRIPHSNLILVAVNVTFKNYDIIYTTAPKDVEYPYDQQHPCQKLNLTNLPRRRLKGCFNEHPEEHEIKTCGRSSTISISVPLFMFILFVILS